MAAAPKPIAVQQLREARAALEQRLTTAIQRQLLDFEAATGLQPVAIEVRMLAVAFLSDSRPRHVLDGVRVTLDI
ncbi:hypothetical protein [Azohydromonas aeria]|uniref:hypothetical protein n=1 Tax=Azohydromonas aeria TaxID=2590212 RepID=UPI0012FCC3DE|nr:hypothetical protein [Azohydromonas aeria]